MKKHKFKSLASCLLERETPLLINNDNMNKMKGEIGKLIDIHIAVLKKELLNAPPAKKAGLFGTLKNWWSNIWHGKSSKKNPYYYQNLLGRIGMTESYIPLEHYKLLSEHTNMLMEKLSAAENTRLFQVINIWAAALKDNVVNLITNCISRGSCKISDISSSVKKSAETEEETGGTTTVKNAPEAIDMPEEEEEEERTNPPAAIIENQIAAYIKKLKDMGENPTKLANILENNYKNADRNVVLNFLKEIFIDDHIFEEFEEKTVSELTEILEQDLTSAKAKVEEHFIEFNSNDTLYERTLICLEKLRLGNKSTKFIY